MNQFNRRSFLKRTAVTATTLSLPAYCWKGVAGANEAVRVAIVGFGGRGGDHISGMRALSGKNVRIIALCDVDETILKGGIDGFSKRSERVEGYRDIRQLLENKDVDAITVATPNHWHALCAIWAAQAGKDVYLEKPVCHNVWEGSKVVEAARQHGRIIQTGTQSRSSHAIKEAVEWVRAGNLGKIRVSRGLCYKPRRSIGKVDGPQPVPSGVDYNLWCGPAPEAPLMRKRLHYDWHWVWNTGNGDLGNQGIHQMDIARWFLGEPQLSPRVWSVGGRLGYLDDGQTPNTQIVFHDYANAPLIFEVRGLPSAKQFQTDKDWNSHMDKFEGGSIACIIECEGGHVLVPNYSSATAFDRNGKELHKWSGATDHYENFINAVRSRKATDLNADIQEGFLSSSLCHTGNISYRLGRRTAPGEILEKIKADRDATATFERMEQHLQANGIEINSDQVVMGEFLKMNPSELTFTNNRDANKLLTREYRAPFVVPDKV